VIRVRDSTKHGWLGGLGRRAISLGLASVLVGLRQGRQMLRTRKHFWLMAAAPILIVGFMVLPWFALSNRYQSRKFRFDAVHEGMTRDEVGQQLIPEEFDLTVVDSRSEISYFAKSRGAFLPNSRAKVTFQNGHVTQKELRDPTIGEVLRYWLDLVKEKVGR
jgi:hypothetical protein